MPLLYNDTGLPARLLNEGSNGASSRRGSRGPVPNLALVCAGSTPATVAIHVMKEDKRVNKAELHADIDRRFTFHPMNKEQAGRAKQLTDAFQVLAHLVAELTPYSREQSTCITLLMESRMMANAAIAINEDVTTEVSS